MATQLVPIPVPFHPRVALLRVGDLCLLCVGEGSAAQGVAWLPMVTGTRGTPSDGCVGPWAFTTPSPGRVVGLGLARVGGVGGEQAPAHLAPAFVPPTVSSHLRAHFLSLLN